MKTKRCHLALIELISSQRSAEIKVKAGLLFLEIPEYSAPKTSTAIASNKHANEYTNKLHSLSLQLEN
jgi:hypothetical protein